MSIAGRGGTYLTKPKRNRIVSIAMILIIAIAGIVGISLVFKSSFHYQESSNNISHVFIELKNLEGAELLIQQGNNTEIGYSVEVTTSIPVNSWGYLDYQVHPAFDNVTNRVSMNFRFTIEINRVVVTLNPNIRYQLGVIRGVNLSTTILTDSTSHISSRFNYEASGNLTLSLDQCNADAQDSMALIGSQIRYPDFVILYLDLPDGFEGEVELPGPGPITIADNVGWSFDGDNTFEIGNAEHGLYVSRLYAAKGYIIWLYD
jgi:hypothetical protein